ncbi:MAG: phosphomannomutase [Candidatus Aenigmarchaeota archaeon]|nr:phosphomannomutase [Candidatus Aenigmarchaeota archaeon]
MSIFRAYDIRGVYPKELNEDIAYKIGLAFGKFLGKGTVAVGMDARNSGPALKENLVKALLEMGFDVIDVGMVPTPLLYFTVAYNKMNAGMMVTGSHNPKEYNGIKLCGENGLCLSYETGVRDVEMLVRKGVETKKLKGNLIKKDIERDYINFVLGKVKFEKTLRIVIDAGNGTAGKVSSELFRRLGCEVIELYCEPDGDFPNHHPDPLVKETLKDLQAKVSETKADLGIAFDGDGDRVSFVDEKGEVLPDNRAFALIIENVLENNPGSKILYEVLCSKLIEDVIKGMKGVPIISRVGHSYIQKTMFDENCLLGGETSGHYYFKENFNYDDAIFAAVKLAELLSVSGKAISELTAALPSYMTSDDTRIHCPDDKKFKVVENIKERFKKDGYKTITLDGVKVVFEDKNSWFIVRPSNTQPAIVLRWEAKDREEFERVGNFVRKEVENGIKAIS